MLRKYSRTTIFSSIGVFLIGLTASIAFGLSLDVNDEFLTSISQPLEADETSLRSQQYVPGEPIDVSGKNLTSIPYLPYEDAVLSDGGTLYATVHTDYLKGDSLLVEFGQSPDCYGQSICDFATYAKLNVDQVQKELFLQLLNAAGTQVPLTENRTGYVIRPQCNMTCDETQLIWLDENTIHLFGTRIRRHTDEDISELQKAANIFIGQDEGRTRE